MLGTKYLYLASVLILVDRFVTEEQLQKGQEYIKSRVKELYEEMPKADVEMVFGKGGAK